MSAAPLIAGVGLGCATAVLLRSPRALLRRLDGPGVRAPATPGPAGTRGLAPDAQPGVQAAPERGENPADPLVWRRRVVLALLVAALGLLSGSWPVGLALIGPAVAADRLLSRLEPASARERTEQIVAGLPTFADLLAATVRAGVPPDRALRVCADVVGGPIGHELGAVVTALELGVAPLRVWGQAAAVPGLEPLARAMERGARRGSSPVVALQRCAIDARRAARTAARRRAQAVAVSAAVPLGLCFLPAFVLVSVVPTVVGGLSDLLR